MGVTSTNYTNIGYAVENGSDGTPADPAFQILPTNGGSPMSTITTAVSEAIRSDRQTDDLVPVDAEVNGDTNFELSYAPYAPILKALLRDNTAIPPASSLTSIVTTVGDAGVATMAAADIGNDYAVGSYINLRSEADPTVNGIYKVTVSTADEITVTPGITAVVTDGTAKKTSYKNGNEVAELFTFRKQVLCGAEKSNFFYPSCSIASAVLNFETGALLSGSFGVYGTVEDVYEEAELPGTPYANQSDIPIPAHSIMNAVTSVADISIGDTLVEACFQTLNLTVDNGTQGAKCIGTLGARSTADFTLDITADITMYFCNLDTYKQFVRSNSFRVSFAVLDQEGNAISNIMPKCKFETLEVPIDGKDNFLTLTGTIRALRDEVDDYMIAMEFMDA